MHSFHPEESASGLSEVLLLLNRHLPYSVPLYKRIQFGHYSPLSRLITSSPVDKLTRSCHSDSSVSLDEPWLIAYSDADRGPETQIYFYGSWEHPSSATVVPDAEHDPHIPALIKAFLEHLRDSRLYHPSTLSSEAKSRLLPTADPTIKHHALLGSVHTSAARIIRSLGVLDPYTPTGIDPTDGHANLPETNNKWIFDLRGQVARVDGNGAAEDEALPDGLRWGTLRRMDFDLVRSRTAIARLDRTLSILPSVVVFPPDTEEQGQQQQQPIAWVLLGVDASLTSMQVEPAYRSRGLAKKLARKAWKQSLDSYTHRGQSSDVTADDRWAHADVNEDNIASNAVCKRLGGTVMWQVYWTRVDLDKLP